MVRTLIFSVALVIAAAVLGYQVKQVGGGRDTISVKGLAEKPVKADRAEWGMKQYTQDGAGKLTLRIQVEGLKQ